MEKKFRYVVKYNTDQIKNFYITLDELQKRSGNYIELESFCESVGLMNYEIISRDQFTGAHASDSMGIISSEIYENDVISFWVCYETSQTHTGDNIPNGSYTEPDEPQLVKINAKVFWDEERGMWSNSIIGKIPYQYPNAFRFVHYEEMEPVILRETYCREYIKQTIAGDMSGRDYEELLTELGFNNEDDLMSKVNTIEVMATIH